MKSIETETRMVVSRGWGGGNELFCGYRVSVVKDEKVLFLHNTVNIADITKLYP